MELRELHNKYDGERIFLIGNGPSLSRTPLSKLNNEYTMAVNKVNSIYQHTDWRPSFYCCLQKSNARSGNTKKCINENIDADTTAFLLESNKDIFGEPSNVFYLNKEKLVNGGNLIYDTPVDEINSLAIKELYKLWSDDISIVVYSFHSMYSMVQIASYMGFSEIYFVGCDLGFDRSPTYMIFNNTPDPHHYSRYDSLYDSKITYLLEGWKKGKFAQSIINGIAYKTATSSFSDQIETILSEISNSSISNHYADDYKGEIIFNNNVDKELIKSHKVSKMMCGEKKIGVYNATIGGELEVYPRVDLEDIL